MRQPPSTRQIVESWRNRNCQKRSMIHILAQLHEVPPEEIARILVEAGELAPGAWKQQEPGAPGMGASIIKWDEPRLQKLVACLARGLSYRETAREMGLTYGQVFSKTTRLGGKRAVLDLKNKGEGENNELCHP